MGTFEDAGQVVDKELAKLKEFLKNEVKPTTLRSAAEALRATSSRLARLAAELEARVQQGGEKTKP